MSTATATQNGAPSDITRIRRRRAPAGRLEHFTQSPPRRVCGPTS